MSFCKLAAGERLSQKRKKELGLSKFHLKSEACIRAVEQGQRTVGSVMGAAGVGFADPPSSPWTPLGAAGTSLTSLPQDVSSPERIPFVSGSSRLQVFPLNALHDRPITGL